MISQFGKLVLLATVVGYLASINIVMAEPAMQGSSHHDMKHKSTKGMHHQGTRARHGSGHDSYIFSAPWKKTLTKEQALKIDKLHLKLKKEGSVVKAKIKLAKLEMAILLTDDSPNQSKIEKLVKQILEFKKQKMKLRNAHIIDMRKVLTEEQRVSFDNKILSMAKHKGGHKSH